MPAANYGAGLGARRRDGAMPDPTWLRCRGDGAGHNPKKVLTGKGVGALQEAGMLDVTPLRDFPRISMLGIFPALQPILAQVLVVAVIGLGFWLIGKGHDGARPKDRHTV